MSATFLSRKSFTVGIFVRYAAAVSLVSVAVRTVLWSNGGSALTLNVCNRLKVGVLQNTRARLLWKWIYRHMLRGRLYADYSKCSPRISIYILRIPHGSSLHVGWFQICSPTYPATFVMRHKAFRNPFKETSAFQNLRNWYPSPGEVCSSRQHGSFPKQPFNSITNSNIHCAATSLLDLSITLRNYVKFSRERLIDEYKNAGRLQTRLIRVASNRVIRKTLLRSSAARRSWKVYHEPVCQTARNFSIL